MSYDNNNLSILPWFDAQSRQNHRKSYTQGQVWPLICAQYRMPCWQIKRAALGTPGVPDPVTSLVITHIQTGATFDLTAAISGAGFGIEQYTPPGEDAYDLLVYNGQSNIEGFLTPEGQYDAVMTDGTNTWHSERFFMRAYLGDLIQIKYWHDAPFLVPGYHISYRNPFYNFVYLNSEVNRPDYEETEEVEERDGYKFSIYATSRKKYKIVGLLLPEYMCDALRVLWMHHYAQVIFQGITYTPDEIRVVFGDWQEPGNVRAVTIEFITDTVVTQTGYIKSVGDGGDYDQTDYNDDHLIS